MRRRRFAVASLVVFAFAAVLGALGAGGKGDGTGGQYLVRAEFDNASFIVKGENVKISGVTVGTVHALDVTPDHHAVLILKIDDPAFQPFRRDAHCSIGLQSLIGEQFVECQPTEARGDSVAPAKPLPRIDSGRGKGEYLLPVKQNSSPVGVDLLNDIMRVPEQQRLPLIINEFGAGLSGNGDSLGAAIRRASPALQQADKLVRILADQDETLSRLVSESDQVLGPLADHRKDLTGFIKNAGDTATATAQEGDALEANFAKFPAFLQQLTPAADRLGDLADQITPTVNALAAQAPAVNEATERLGPLAKQSTPALKTLGNVADRGRKTFPEINALVSRLDELGTPLEPLAKNLAALSSSFDDTGGIESLMRFIYFYTGSVNGEDASGHYTRAGMGANACIDRASVYDPGCGAKYNKNSVLAASAAKAAKATKTKAPAAPAAAAKSGVKPASAGASARLLDYLLAP
jgi:phospholipid/cholesterol/gamma-HCH transport system substrate-binding protein